MTTVVETITPEMARKYLATSKGNRTISRPTVAAYARDMANGNWMLNGEPIAFDIEGHLVNGHHRLYACIEANTSFTTNVARGVPNTAIFDQNRVRSMRDQFKLNGEPDLLCDYLLLATIRRHLLLKKGIGKATSTEIKDFYSRNEANLKKAMSVARKGYSTIRKAPVVYALFCAITCGVPMHVIERFCEVCAYGTLTDPTENSALKCREFIYTHSTATKPEALSMQHATEAAIHDFCTSTIRKRGYTSKEKPVYSNQRIMDLI